MGSGSGSASHVRKCYFPLSVRPDPAIAPPPGTTMRPLPLLRVTGLLLLVGSSYACGGEACGPDERCDEPAAAETAPVTVSRPPASFETVQALRVLNAHEPVPGLITAGQLTPEQFAVLADAGYTNLISLRLPEESGTGWEEAFAAGRNVSFSRVPVAGAGGLTRAAVEEIDRLLAEGDGAPTVLYCGSANRVGALLALRAHWLGGASPEEALAIGRAAGMTQLEPAVANIMATEGSGF